MKLIGVLSASMTLAGAGLAIPAVATAADTPPGPLATSSSNAPFTQDPVMAPTVVSPDGKMAYVAASSDTRHTPGSIAFVNVSNATVTRTVKVGWKPAGLAITPDGKRLGVSSWQDKSVTVLDTRSGKVLRKVPVGGEADTVFIGPKGSSLFTFLIDQGVIAKIDLKTYQVTGRFDTKIPGHGSCKKAWTEMAMTADSKTLLLSCSNGGLLSFDTASGRMKGMALGVGGGTPIISPDGTSVYWGGEYYYQGTNVKTMKNLFDVQLLRKGDGGVDGVEAALAVAVSKDGSKTYATMPDVGAVAVIDPKTGQERMRVLLNGRPYLGATALTLNPDGTRLYATQRDGGVVTIDTATDTVIGLDPQPDSSATTQSTTVGRPAVNLAGGRLGRAWATFHDSNITAAGFAILTMPEN